MNIIEAIRERRSVRNYDGQPFSGDIVAALNQAVEDSTSPFGGSVTIRLRSFDLKGPFKPSTYGLIDGATDFFLIAALKDKQSLLTVGYRFEQVVLKAWQMGLGTCWIAGTFKGTDFNRGEAWPYGQELVIVSPVGRALKQSLKEKIMRLAVGSNKRRPFSTMFFDKNFDTPLNETSRFGLSLGMMRLAPSSANSQPWRALVSGDTVHFYYKPKSNVSLIDCGIGLCHFEITERTQGREGSFVEETNIPLPPGDWKYLVSYRTHLVTVKK